MIVYSCFDLYTYAKREIEKEEGNIECARAFQPLAKPSKHLDESCLQNNLNAKKDPRCLLPVTTGKSMQLIVTSGSRASNPTKGFFFEPRRQN